MFNIAMLTTAADDCTATIQTVADIEALVQPQDAWSYQTVIELLAQDSVHLLVVYQSEKIVGYCLYQRVFEQAEILRIGTHPNYQRQGIASKLFSWLNEALQVNQVKSLLLEVRADNAPAIALYEKQDFTMIHKRKGYYQSSHQPAVDALIMQRIYTLD